MTEDEAKTKWCPFAVAVHRNQPSGGNRLMRSDNGSESPVAVACRCIGSGCMGWRKDTVFIDRATGEAAIPGEAAAGSLELRYSGHGYCGLAGKQS